MRNVQGPFTDRPRFRVTRKPKNYKGFWATGTIYKRHKIYIVLKPDSQTMRRMPRFKPWEYSSFRGLPVSTDSDSSPSDKDLLDGIYKRAEAIIHLAGDHAEMLRFDFIVGVKPEDIQKLFERLQRLARGKGSRIHFVAVSELAPRDTQNHWHAVIWFDGSVMDFPAQINGAWEKIRGDKKIKWLRNNFLPFRFRIGRSQVEFERAFFTASYLSKSSQPPLPDPKHKARIISRMPVLPSR